MKSEVGTYYLGILLLVNWWEKKRNYKLFNKAWFLGFGKKIVLDFINVHKRSRNFKDIHAQLTQRRLYRFWLQK